MGRMMNQPRRPKKESGPLRRESSEVFVMRSTLPIVEWAKTDLGEAPPLLVIPGPSFQDRLAILSQWECSEWRKQQPWVVTDTRSAYTRSWPTEGVLHNLTNRIARIIVPSEVKDRLLSGFPPVPGIWEIVWALISADDFLVEEPLRGMVDRSFYLVHDVYRALWEARFLIRENASREPATQLVGTLIRWLTAEPLLPQDQAALEALGIKRLVSSEQERFDVLCFLLTLAAQNGIVERVLFLFDGLEDILLPEYRSVLRQFQGLLHAIERWVSIGGCPLGILLGFRGSKTDHAALRRLHPKLAVEVARGLSWVGTR